ncbi:DUF945 domain-containing protein [Leptospira interrogans]|uniref:DUF932 domain-containing protein n=1 Tax=Leptospira interrogans TaxID=173 RepID=UPI001EEFFF5A|nr:DUF932 domain-containing protein [Leptospira interrogans]ULG76283.1 DUF945 domain-containing protein [Leptospira interrogans]
MGISEEELKRRIPSVYSGAYFGQVSERYLQIKTSDVLSLFLDLRWEIQSATAIQVRNQERHGFQKHMIILEHPSMIFEDEGKMNVVIRNSHDQSNSLEIFYGFMRIVCANQLMVRNLGKVGNHASFRHYKTNLNLIKERVVEILFGFNDLQADIRFLQAKELNPFQVKSFAKKAVDYRFGTNFLEFRTELIEAALQTRRTEDCGNIAWKVLNRVQETLVNGIGRYATQATLSKSKKIRSLKNIDRLISFNDNL